MSHEHEEAWSRNMARLEDELGPIVPGGAQGGLVARREAALRAEGHAEAVADIVATLRERAEALRVKGRDYDETEAAPQWVYGAFVAAGELERAAQHIEQALAATKEGT